MASSGYVDQEPCSQRRQEPRKGNHLRYLRMDAGWPEDVVHASVASTARKRKPFKIHVVRYADDFIITGATKAVLQHQVRPAIEAFLKERGLELSDEKTQITHISQGFDFLGQNVRKYAGKLLITRLARV